MLIEFILVDCFKDNTNKEEEQEFPKGYRQVSIALVAEVDVDVVQVEKDKGKVREG